MRFLLSSRAKRDYLKLTKVLQKSTDKQFYLLLKNLMHPSLHAKKYDETKEIWQARVSKSYRFYFRISGREFEEETGLEFNFREISVIDNVNFRIKSQRPGQDFHQDTFYLITSKNFPDTESKPDKQIEEVKFFPIYSLPVKPVKNATLAFGHRAKLEALLSSSHSYLEALGIEVESVINLLAV